MTYAENVTKPDNVWLHTLVAGSRWNTPGVGTDISVYIGDNEKLKFDDGHLFSIAALTPDAVENDMIALTLQLFENVADIHFTITDDRDDADIVLAVAKEKYLPGFLGYSYFPGDLLNPNTGRDQSIVAVNHDAYDDPPKSVEQGGFDFVTFIHEFGHAVGLDHPHDGVPPFPGVDSPFDDYGLFDMNQGIYTMMTYNDGWNTGPDGKSPNSGYGFEATPMALDIAALQYLYGANTTFASGNDTYELKGVNKPGTFYSSIWDAGGTDTIRYDGDLDCTIDLRAATLHRFFGGGGFVSYVGGIYGGYTVAHGAVIERAIGGEGDDELRGNGHDNVLFGRAGDDLLRSGKGDDVIVGGGDGDRLRGEEGSDQFVYRHAADSSPIDRDTIADFVNGDDKIVLAAIDADGTLAGNQAFTFLGQGADLTGAGDLRFAFEPGNTLIEASTDADPEAELAILLRGHIHLTAGDFVL